jgi:uncharacterized coiled-coil protein SlyX
MTDINRRIDDLETVLAALVQGVTMMNQTLGTHSEMLSEILEATTAPVPSSGISEEIAKIGEILEAQDAVMRQMADSLRNLPRDIAAAVRSAP